MELRWFVRSNGERVLQHLRDGIWINITMEYENGQSADELPQERSGRSTKRKQVDNHRDRVDTNAPRKNTKRNTRSRMV